MSEHETLFPNNDDDDDDDDNDDDDDHNKFSHGLV